ACRHEEVIERAMRVSPVVPARLATLFSSRETLAAWLEAHHDPLSRALDRFAGHDEWAVKGALDRRRAKVHFLDAALARQGGAVSSSPGKRYFEERRIQAGIGQEIEAWLKEASAGIGKALLDHAVDFRERRIVSGGTPDDAGARVLNWAFLVPRSRVDDFRERIRQINAKVRGPRLGPSATGTPSGSRGRCREPDRGGGPGRGRLADRAA
ncbi:MAG: GvpL/GvpF family gas vesicle protein, partial [Deltaproteobacteria bacterium]|nr:GvpL/GvpF family gas vesicle protein [Deltaproteobacteria bacterium]